jgi:hypothetical protein
LFVCLTTLLEEPADKWEKLAKEARENANSNRDLEDTILKMAEIKKLANKYFPPDEVQGILWTVEMRPSLDQGIEEFRRKGATDYPKS